MATVLASPLDEQSVYIRWTKWRFNLSDATTSLMCAQLRLENGPKGCEAGMKALRPTSVHGADVQAYADPTMPDGAEQHSRLARRILESMQNWVMDDPFRRREWMKHYTARFRAGGTESNRDYYLLLRRLLREELSRTATGSPVREDYP